MTCKACLERGKTWNGDDPKCGFENGAFDESNWNCATVGLIRDLVYEYRDGGEHPKVDFRYLDDQKYATLEIDGSEVHAMALWVTWYKNRGRTEEMWLLGYEAPRKPTEEECLQIVAFLTRPTSTSSAQRS